jgi:hypothetical protein
MLSAHEFEAVAVNKIGPIKGKFKGCMVLFDLDPSNDYRSRVGLPWRDWICQGRGGRHAYRKGRGTTLMRGCDKLKHLGYPLITGGLRR